MIVKEDVLEPHNQMHFIVISRTEKKKKKEKHYQWKIQYKPLYVRKVTYLLTAKQQTSQIRVKAKKKKKKEKKSISF